MGLSADLKHGNSLGAGSAKPSLWDMLNAHAGLADLTALKALLPTDRSDTMRAKVLAGQAKGHWRYEAASTLTGDDKLVATPTDAPSAGRWVRDLGALDLILPISFATADAAVLATMPTGWVFKIDDLAWEVTADFTGGTTPAIGVSSNKTTPTNWSTKGDLLGGAAGELTAALVATNTTFGGTIGTDMDTVVKRRGAVWKGGDTFRFDRIADAFAAGTGFVHVYGLLMASPG